MYYSNPLGEALARIMKYRACEEFKNGSTSLQIWGAIGCSTIQISIYKMHEKSDDHKFAFIRWRACHFLQSEPCSIYTPTKLSLEVIVDHENARILTVMKLLYFIVYNDLPLLQYVEQCQIHTLLSTPNMPATVEYSNVIVGMRFLNAISEHLRGSLLNEVKLNPCYLILIDESTNRTCEFHLIVYLCYLS